MGTPNPDFKSASKSVVALAVSSLKIFDTAGYTGFETLEQYEKRMSHPLTIAYIWLVFVVLPAFMLIAALLGIPFPGK